MKLKINKLTIFIVLIFSIFFVTSQKVQAGQITIPNLNNLQITPPTPNNLQIDPATPGDLQIKVPDITKLNTVTTPLKTPDLNPLGNLQIKIPGIDKLAIEYPIVCTTTSGVESCQIPWIAIYIYAIYDYLLAISGVLAVIALMIGGVIWLISAGNASRITQAKSWISGSLTGVLILLTSYILLYQINPNLVNTTYINLETIVPLQDADITVVGGESPFMEGCKAAKKGDYSICKAYGDIEPSGLTTYKGKKINTEILEKYEAAMECVKQKNGKYLFYINEAWRSAATQISYTERGLPASVPCCSNHGSGQAMDLSRLDGTKMSWDYNVSSGLKECMNAQGLYANLTSGKYNEPWHWSPSGR